MILFTENTHVQHKLYSVQQFIPATPMMKGDIFFGPRFRSSIIVLRFGNEDESLELVKSSRARLFKGEALISVIGLEVKKMPALLVVGITEKTEITRKIR
jgi:hypothetical protein